jgi:hypothetical protein
MTSLSSDLTSFSSDLTYFLAQSYTGQTEHCALGQQIYTHSLFHTKLLLLLQFPSIIVPIPTTEPFIGTGAGLGFNDQERTNKTLTTNPFGNTYEADEVSPKVEAGVVAGLMCLQP